MINDPVRQYLRRKRASDHVVAAGLSGLVGQWETFARSVARGYQLDLDSYLNDLDARQLLSEALNVAPLNERQKYLARIAKADDLFKLSVKPLGRCLWGDAVAAREGWTAENNWWYFSRPISAGPELTDDLKAG